MKVVLLAGGIGKRMFPIIEDKFLLKFCGKPLLIHQIDMLRSAGFDEFVIIGNPFNIKAIKEMTQGMKVELAVQKQPKGMANALITAEKLLKEDGLLVVSTNDVVDVSAYKSVLNVKDADSVIMGCEMEQYFPGGYLVLDGKNIKGVVEKPGAGNEPSDVVNVVVHLHRNSRELFRYMKSAKTNKDDQYEVAMDNMIKDGFKFKVSRYCGFWRPVKFPWHIFDICDYFLSRIKGRQIAPDAKIAKSAVVEGDVMIGRGAKIFGNAMVKGPAYIGDGAVVGNNALVRDYSHIGANSVVGFATEVTRSYVGDNCWFHSNYIGDSVISDNCSFGAGSVTANFRFDEGDINDTGRGKLGCIMGENCKTGINVSLMPGVKIGPNSIVGPHVMLHKDLGPDKIALLKQGHTLIKNTIKFDKKKKAELMKKLRDGKKKTKQKTLK
jgi:bifunctional UDP-N-acetylglucosamine pyrophosphorylase/glucosamine-1-phosphate N-acetyltransferase